MSNIESSGPIVVVGVDGSLNSVEALRWAASYAQLSGAELRAVTAWQSMSGFGFAPVPHKEWERQAEHELDRVVRKALGDNPSVRVTKKVVDGNPAAVLIEESNDADLLVVGDRGYEGFSGLLLGHVGETCARNAHCSVIVVRGHRERSVATPANAEGASR